MNAKQVKQVEDICNDVSRQNQTVYAMDAPLAQAKAIQGLRAVFDEVTGGRTVVVLGFTSWCLSHRVFTEWSLSLYEMLKCV